VCSQPFDHTSVLQFVERLTGVKETNISDWRRKTFGDLIAAFRFASAPPPLPDIVHTLNLARYEVAYLPKPTLPTRIRNCRRKNPATATTCRRRIERPLTIDPK
jgi:phospholipase C